MLYSLSQFFWRKSSLFHTHQVIHLAARRTTLGLLGGLSIAVLPALLAPGVETNMVAFAQSTDAAATQSEEEGSQAAIAPTARYANGENVDLAEIITEWRGYYEDVPVYLCICQDGTCDQTEQWPYREYDRYQFSVALGPTNGRTTEENGFNCFDISDGSRPTNPREFSSALTTAEPTTDSTGDVDSTSDTDADTAVSTPVESPDSLPAPTNDADANDAEERSSEDSTTENSGIPVATAINNGADIRLDWPSGRSDTLNVTTAGRAWNINILNALECETLSAVEEKTLSAQRVVGSPVVDQSTGYVAVPVLLSSCIEIDQMAVFIVDPTEGGAYKLYRTQLPSVRGLSASQDVVFPNESSSYAYSTIVEMRYWDSTLLVRQADASGAAVISIFRPGPTPAGTYAGCGVVSEGEGATALCNQ